MPSRAPPTAQMSLQLTPSPPSPAIEVPEEAVSALADLLLAAVRDKMGTSRTENGDE
jgi:hypothetical protein